MKARFTQKRTRLVFSMHQLGFWQLGGFRFFCWCLLSALTKINAKYQQKKGFGESQAKIHRIIHQVPLLSLCLSCYSTINTEY